MIIAVYGLGFVGLTTALGLADKGFSVRGYDIDKGRATDIARGTVPFHEPGLDEALTRNLGKTFSVAKSAAQAAQDSDVCFFCVGTPGLPDGSADLTYLLSAIDSTMGSVSDACVYVVKSTVPPGTISERVIPYLRSKGMANPVASNPEFLREGKCWEDFTSPDRIVCGVSDEGAKSTLSKVYEPFGAPLHFVEPSTAEYIKYLSNSLLATLISYANEMSLIAGAVGDIDIAKAFRILHEDRRLAGSGINSYIYPGCGFGGYCLPKDTEALFAAAKTHGYEPGILGEVITLNDAMPAKTAAKIERLAGSQAAKIGILGLSFKPNSDDVRDTSAAKIIACLQRDGYQHIYAYDPVATEAFKEMYGLDVIYYQSKEAVCDACDTIAVVTIWPEFQGIDRQYPDKKFCDCRYWLE